jgi:hypothetical protein
VKHEEGPGIIIYRIVHNPDETTYVQFVVNQTTFHLQKFSLEHTARGVHIIDILQIMLSGLIEVHKNRQLSSQVSGAAENGPIGRTASDEKPAQEAVVVRLTAPQETAVPEQWNLQGKPPGRPPHKENDETYEKLLTEGEQIAFDFWCQKKQITNPNAKDRQNFKQSMERAAKRHKNI